MQRPPRWFVVNRRKVAEYLLNPQHADGQAKARFFAAHGFSRTSWRDLAEALLAHADSPLTTVTLVAGDHGRKCIFDGPMVPTPRGTTPGLRAVWMQETDSDTAVLVTAYPRTLGRDALRMISG